jgi:hypothetical protein
MKYSKLNLRTNNTHIPMQVNEHILTSRRNVGRPRKRWMDQHPRRQHKLGVANTLLMMIVVAVVVAVVVMVMMIMMIS